MKKTIVITAIGIVGIISLQTQAALIEIAIEAEVDYLNDPGNLLEGNVNIGDIINGVYIYDSDAIDSEPSMPYYGSYNFFQQPYGILLEINDLYFETDPSNTDFHIGITNDDPWDVYNIISDNNLPILNNVPVKTIQWELQDYSEQALSDISLPISAPVLNDWPDENWLTITGGGDPKMGEGPGFGIGAEVISAVLIPEPTSFVLIILGGLTIRKRIFRFKR